MTSLAEPHTHSVDPVIEELDAIHRASGHGLADVFRDWVDLLVAMFSLDDDRHGETLEKCEGHADVHDVAEHFAAAAGEWMQATIDAQHGTLGDVYEEIGASSDSLGQFFTPYNVSDMMAEMHFSTEEFADAADREEPYRVGDPACGSGRMLLSVAKNARERLASDECDVDPADFPGVVYSGKDRDPVCAKMTAVNLAFAGMAGYAVLGDTLKGTTSTVWVIDPKRAPPLSEQPDGPDPFAPDAVDESDEVDEPQPTGQIELGEWST